MRTLPILPLLALMLTAPAQAGIQFLGHDVVVQGVVARTDWSSDLGPDYVAVRPVGLLQHGFTVTSDTSRVIEGGPVAATTTITVAPAGTITGATPVYVFEGREEVTNLGSGYGRSATSEHTACLRFTPPGAGQLVYWAIRWRSSGTTSQSALRDMNIATESTTYATSAGPDSGFITGTLPGATSGFCGINVRHGYFVGAGATGSADRTLRVEVYLDSAPILGAPTMATPALALAAPAPNPSPGRARFAFSLPEPGTAASLRIVDVSGRTVRLLQAPAGTVGPGVIEWDGRDERGVASAPGVYLARLMQGSKQASRRFAMTR